MSIIRIKYTKNFHKYMHFCKAIRTITLLTVITSTLLAITIIATVNANCLPAPQAEDNTPEGTNVTVQFADKGINLTFANVTKSGRTSVDISTTGPALPDGYNFLDKYYSITTTSCYTGNITACITYSDIGIEDESNLQLFHYKIDEKETIVYVQTEIDVANSTWDLASKTHSSLLYYDLDNAKGSERLHIVINAENYEINGSGDHFIYETTIYLKDGCCFIAWLGQPYYVVESGNDWFLTEMLVDEDADVYHLLRVGESLALPGGFAITPLEIDVDGGMANFSITQDDEEVDSSVIKERMCYVYEADLNESGYNDNWVLTFNLESVYAGINTNLVKINGINLVSPNMLKIETPYDDTLSNFKITSDNSNHTLQIKLNQSSDKIQLLKGNTVSFLKDTFHFRISEKGDAGGFVIRRSEIGTHEIFAQVSDAIDTGNPSFSLASATHPSIFYYDFDNEYGDEVLEFTVNSAYLEIRKDDFTYETSIYSKDNLPYIAWLGKPYYVVENGSDWYLSELLIDEKTGDNHLIRVGEALPLAGGFAIVPLEIDVDARDVLISITQDGKEVDMSGARKGTIIEYRTDLNESGENDNRVLRFNIESVYVSNYSIRINEIQLISPDPLKIETPDDNTIPGFKIKSASPYNSITIEIDEDDDKISLQKNGTVSFLNDTFHFRINEDGDIGGIHTILNVTGTWIDVTSSQDIDTNTICGTVTDLSEFIIAGH